MVARRKGEEERAMPCRSISFPGRVHGISRPGSQIRPSPCHERAKRNENLQDNSTYTGGVTPLDVFLHGLALETCRRLDAPVGLFLLVNYGRVAGGGRWGRVGHGGGPHHQEDEAPERQSPHRLPQGLGGVLKLECIRVQWYKWARHPHGTYGYHSTPPISVH